MTSMPIHRVPEDLVLALVQSDSKNGGPLSLSAADRLVAIGWLNHALLDFQALDAHIAVLQQAYDSPFRYPRPRRDCWSADQLTEAVPQGHFTRFKKLDEARIVAVMDRGVEALNDAELAELLINPLALYDLLDVIDDIQPEYWIDLAIEHGTSVESGDSPTRTEQRASEKDRAIATNGSRFPIMQAARSGSASAGQENYDSSSRLADRSSNTSWFTWMAQMSSGLALAVSLGAILIAWRALDHGPTASSPSPTSKGGDKVEFVGSTGQEATWEEILEATKDFPEVERLEKISDALPSSDKDWVRSMKEAGCSDAQILATLNAKYSPKPKNR